MNTLFLFVTDYLSSQPYCTLCRLRFIVEVEPSDIIKQHLLSDSHVIAGTPISHLILDGSVAPDGRQTLVDRFNHDKSIDVLVLTTHVSYPFQWE